MKTAAWLVIFVSVLAWSAYQPKDLLTWFMETVPAMIALLVMAVTRRRFALTPLLYILVLVHSLILMVGGHYTYAEVPLFDDLQSYFGWTRNNYDKVGHFAQGFVPAIAAREVLLRLRVINGRYWCHFLVVSFVLAFSAFYELLEWLAATVSATGAEAFLGTQGYVWDTQSDMAWALLGAVISLICLSHYHDRQLGRLITSRSPT